MIVFGLTALAAVSAPTNLLDLMDEAQERNETFGIAREQIQQSEADVRRAWAALLPTVELRGSYTRRPPEIVSGNQFLQADALAGQFEVGLRVLDAPQIPTIGAADDRQSAQAARSRDLERGLRFDVADAYFTVLVAEGAEEAARERLRLAERSYRDADRRFQAGLSPRNDVSRTALELADARVTMTQAQNLTRQSRLRLGFFVGRPVTEALAPPEATFSVQTATIAVADRAVDLRPDLDALRSERQAAGRDAVEPWLRLIPAVEALGRGAIQNDGFLPDEILWSIQLTAIWRLYDGGERYADARANAARERELELSLRQLERQVRLEVESALLEINAADAARAQAEEQRRISDQNYQEVRERFTQGLATAVEQADAAVQRFEGEVALETAIFAQRQARLNLGRALGFDSPVELIGPQGP